MNSQGPMAFDQRMRDALSELQNVIAKHYPTATFTVARGEDEPENVHLMAVVDVEDTDEVMDLVIDRVVELQVDERIPVHVVPIRTPERVRAARQSSTGRSRSCHALPLFEKVPSVGR